MTIPVFALAVLFSAAAIVAAWERNPFTSMMCSLTSISLGFALALAW